MNANLADAKSLGDLQSSAGQKRPEQLIADYHLVDLPKHAISILASCWFVDAEDKATKIAAGSPYHELKKEILEEMKRNGAYAEKLREAYKNS